MSRNFVEGAFQGRGEYYRLICGDDVEPIETHLAILQCAGKADIIIPYYTRIDGRPVHRRAIAIGALTPIAELRQPFYGCLVLFEVQPLDQRLHRIVSRGWRGRSLRLNHGEEESGKYDAHGTRVYCRQGKRVR